jgi:hypothetical protein
MTTRYPVDSVMIKDSSSATTFCRHETTKRLTNKHDSTFVFDPTKLALLLSSWSTRRLRCYSIRSINNFDFHSDYFRVLRTDIRAT